MVCDGSCSKCGRCLRLYLYDAEDWGDINAWRTWLDCRMALPNSSSDTARRTSADPAGSTRDAVRHPAQSQCACGLKLLWDRTTRYCHEHEDWLLDNDISHPFSARLFSREPLWNEVLTGYIAGGRREDCQYLTNRQCGFEEQCNF